METTYIPAMSIAAAVQVKDSSDDVFDVDGEDVPRYFSPPPQLQRDESWSSETSRSGSGSRSRDEQVEVIREGVEDGQVERWQSGRAGDDRRRPSDAHSIVSSGTALSAGFEGMSDAEIGSWLPFLHHRWKPTDPRPDLQPSITSN